MLASITIDVHQGDFPEDIHLACEWLLDRRIRATFFVPSDLLTDHRYTQALRSILACGHEAASHSHHHDQAERRALSCGSPRELGFLGVSKAMHEEYFGESPVGFRSPCWSRLGHSALAELRRLGYRVDSSATPQRLSILSSDPFGDTWTFTPRGLYAIWPGLLEVPTTCLLLPAGSPTFATLRGLTQAFLSLLVWEARHVANRVLTLQFHVNEFNPRSQYCPCRRRLRLADFMLSSDQGFGFKYALLDGDPRSIYARMESILTGLRHCECMAMADVETRYRLMKASETTVRRGARWPATNRRQHEATVAQCIAKSRRYFR